MQTPYHTSLGALLRVVLVAGCLACAGCGGDDDSAAIETAAEAPPAITSQPADVSVAAGQAATFSVEASGTAPMTYQWKRGGSDIVGATDVVYTLPATAIGDNGAGFAVTVANGGGSADSRTATLTVTAAAVPPVLTITQQPAGTSVVAGATASFIIAATCSSGTLGIQWQRSQAGAAFADVAGARAATYMFSTVAGDSGATFRAALDCAGQSATASSVAMLTVTAPTSVTTTVIPIVDTSEPAFIFGTRAVIQAADGSFVFTTVSGVKRLSADLTIITRVAGGDATGYVDGPAASARFNGPQGIAQDAAGNFYVTDGFAIRRIAPDGMVSTLAGMVGVAGTTDGIGGAARFAFPAPIAIGPDGDLYVADVGSGRVRRVTTAGVVTTYAGSSQGFADGAPAAAKFNDLLGLAVAANGDVLVSDRSNNRVRRIVRAGNVAGTVETLAGNGMNIANPPDGTGTAAVMPQPYGMMVRGNTLAVLTDGLLRQIDLTTGAVTTVAGSRALGRGYADGPAPTARLGDGGVAPAPNGGFILVDKNETYAAVRSVSASGDVRTIASARTFGTTLTGTGVLAQMPIEPQLPFDVYYPAQSVAVDPAGNIVIAEGLVQDVRRISSAGVISLAAGLVGSEINPGTKIVDGTGSAAQFESVGYSIVSDSAGVLYVGDAHSVRRIGTDNATTLFAGSRTAAGAVDGNASTARFGTKISSLAIGPNGDLFVADLDNFAIRRIDSAGNVSTYAGALGQAGTADGPSVTARLAKPKGIAFAPDGALVIADKGRIRRVSPDGASVSTLFEPSGFISADFIAVDADGSIYFGGDSDAPVSRGLYKLAPGVSAATVLLPFSGDNLVSPLALGYIHGIALAGPKQIVLLTSGRILKVTLP